MNTFLESLRGRGLITAEQSARLERTAAQKGESPIRSLNRLGYVEPQVLVAELSRHFRIRQLGESDWPETRVLPDCISPRFMREHRVLPLRADSSSVTIAVSDPADVSVLEAIRIASERQLDLRIATESQIVSRIERLLDGPEGQAISTSASFAIQRSEDDEEQLRDLALDAPVIDLVNKLFREASAARATDLHIEPARGRVMVRRRVDGMLQEAGTLPSDFGRAAVSRIKILTNLNIAERRLPQDGRARVRVGDREYDIRVATIPTIHGESIAIRFLAASDQVPDINKLGLVPQDIALLKEQAMYAHGLIVVT